MHNLSGLDHMRNYAKARAKKADFFQPHTNTNRSGEQVKFTGITISDYQNESSLPTIQLDPNISPAKSHRIFKTSDRIEVLERTFDARIDKGSYDEFHYHLHLYLLDKGTKFQFLQQERKLICQKL